MDALCRVLAIQSRDYLCRLTDDQVIDIVLSLHANSEVAVHPDDDDDVPVPRTTTKAERTKASALLKSRQAFIQLAL